MIEKILRTLFDYQKYENDPGLSSMIDDTHKRYDKKRFRTVSLKDDDLGLVSAAGDFDTGVPDEPKILADKPEVTANIEDGWTAK